MHTLELSIANKHCPFKAQVDWISFLTLLLLFHFFFYAMLLKTAAICAGLLLTSVQAVSVELRPDNIKEMTSSGQWYIWSFILIIIVTLC